MVQYSFIRCSYVNELLSSLMDLLRSLPSRTRHKIGVYFESLGFFKDVKICSFLQLPKILLIVALLISSRSFMPQELLDNYWNWLLPVLWCDRPQQFPEQDALMSLKCIQWFALFGWNHWKRLCQTSRWTGGDQLLWPISNIAEKAVLQQFSCGLWHSPYFREQTYLPHASGCQWVVKLIPYFRMDEF